MERKYIDKINSFQEFIESFKNWNINFKDLDYEYNKYDCEVATIVKAQKDQDWQTLVNLWNQKSTNRTFELQHPIHNDITTRAVHNVLIGDINFVFMLDKDNKYPWIFTQYSDFINAIIVKDAMYCHLGHWCISNPIWWYSKCIQDANLDLVFYKDIEWNFIASHTRPGHFLFDFAEYLYKITPKKKIYGKKTYFFLERFEKTLNTNSVYLMPVCCWRNHIECEAPNLLYKEVTNSQKIEGAIDYDLTIWLQIPAERRQWFQQIEGCSLIIKELTQYFKKTKVYFDGMTSYDGEKRDFPDNETNFYKVVNATKKMLGSNAFIYEANLEQEIDNERLKYLNQDSLVVFTSLIGYDFRTKIRYCDICDIAIHDTGTATIFPFICKKRSIIYSSNASSTILGMSKLFAEFNHGKTTDSTYILTETEKLTINHSFHIPPEHIYNLTAECLEELSLEGKLQGYNKDNPLKMHRLPVPPVSLYAKKYELEKKFNCSFSIEQVALVMQSEEFISERLAKYCVSDTMQVKNIYIKENQNAVERIRNHLAYKLGSAMILNSKSLWGYIRMPYVLSFIKESHEKEIADYEARVLKNPKLKLPPLESYADYQDALKEKECYTYKLGAALMEANKTWLKGGYLWFYLESKRLKREFEKERKWK